MLALGILNDIRAKQPNYKSKVPTCPEIYSFIQLGTHIPLRVELLEAADCCEDRKIATRLIRDIRGTLFYLALLQPQSVQPDTV